MNPTSRLKFCPDLARWVEPLEPAGFEALSTIENPSGPNFNPEVGFVERTNCICDYMDATLKPRPKVRGLRELNFEGFLFHAPDTHHALQTQEWQGTFRAEFNNGSYTDDDIVNVFTQKLTEPFNIYKNVFLPVGDYHWTRHQLTYGSPQDRRLTVSFFERFGTYYNGRLNEARVRSTYRANERLSFNFSEQWNRFRLLVAGGDFSVLVGSLQTNYSFSRFLTLSALAQMNTANRQAVIANIRLRWNYRPDSDLYVNHRRAGVSEPCFNQPAAILREPPCDQVHLTMQAVRSPDPSYAAASEAPRRMFRGLCPVSTSPFLTPPSSIVRRRRTAYRTLAWHISPRLEK